MEVSNFWLSAQTLRQRLGTPYAPLIIDVRRDEAYEQSARVIAASRWRDHRQTEQWASELPAGADVLVYCVHGHQVSQSSMAVLRSLGHDAKFLETGIEGFIEAGGTTVARRSAFHRVGMPSRWVTRCQPGIDRLACAWLIRRFVDRGARIHYVERDQVLAVAAELDAIGFGVEGAPFAHAQGRCSFDALLDHFDIQDEALHHVARIVRSADTARGELEPQCAGLHALSLGLFALHKDEHRVFEHAMVVYDALYAWARDAQGQSHRRTMNNSTKPVNE